MAPIAHAQSPDNATVIVLDASGSMWGQLADGVTKVETARGVLRDYLAGRNMSVPLGLVAYGHNRKGDCGDIEVLAGVGVQDAGALSDRIDGLNPRGKTPLTEALRMAAAQIPRTAEAADIVLVTDGLETCDADPCALARELAAEGIEIRAHVVGFGLTDAEADTLACIPQLTGGKLLTPQTGADLADALAETDIASAEPAPPGAPGVLPARITIAEEAGTARPASVILRATRVETGETIELGRLQGADEVISGLRVDLEPGRWRIAAEGPVGSGEIDVDVAAADQIVAVPFAATAALAILPRGPMQAGGEHLVLVRYDRPLQDNATFYLALRPEGSETDAAWTYVYAEDARFVGRPLTVPAQAGRYDLVVVDGGDAVVTQTTVEVLADAPPAIEAPARVRPGARFPFVLTGQRYPNNGLAILRGGERVSDIWLGETIGSDGERLTAPGEPGRYTIALDYTAANGEGRTVELATFEVAPDAPAEPTIGADDRAAAPPAMGGEDPATMQSADEAAATIPTGALHGDWRIETEDGRSVLRAQFIHDEGAFEANGDFVLEMAELGRVGDPTFRDVVVAPTSLQFGFATDEAEFRVLATRDGPLYRGFLTPMRGGRAFAVIMEPAGGYGLDADAHGAEAPADEAAFVTCEAGPCTRDHEETKLTGIPIPAGWALDEPFVYETAGGARADAPTLHYAHAASGDWIAVNGRQVTDAVCRAMGSGRFDEGPDQICVPRSARGETFAASEEIEHWWNGWRENGAADGGPSSDGETAGLDAPFGGGEVQ